MQPSPDASSSPGSASSRPLQPGPQASPSLASAPERPGPLSPGAAFLILLVILATAFWVGALLFDRAPAELQPLVIRASNKPLPTPAADADHPRPLSARQAIARFEVLNALRLRAYRERDTSLFARYLVPNSPLLDIGVKEIKRLRRDGVTMRPNFVTQRLTVRRRTRSEIIVRQIVRQNPKFFNRSGKDITVPRPPKLVTVDWTLEPVGERWMISRSLIQRVETIGKRTRKGHQG
jgi:hypothetical protein